MSNRSILKLDVEMIDPQVVAQVIDFIKTQRAWLTVTREVLILRAGQSVPITPPTYVLTGDAIKTRYSDSLTVVWQNGKYIVIGDNYATGDEVKRITKDMSKAYKHYGGVKVLTKLKYKVKQDTRTMVAHGRRY